MNQREDSSGHGPLGAGTGRVHAPKMRKNEGVRLCLPYIIGPWKYGHSLSVFFGGHPLLGPKRSFKNMFNLGGPER